MGLAWGIGIRLTNHLVQKYGTDPRPGIIYYSLVFIAAWLGAKAFFLYYSAGSEFVKYASMSSFWLGGGFVFYGGVIFSLPLILYYSFFAKTVHPTNIPLFIPPLLFAHSVGRVGCFLAGCCYGSETEHFLSIAVRGASRHPVQLYESISVFILGIISLALVRKRVKEIYQVSFYLVGYSTVRFFLEFLRGDTIRGIHFDYFSTSQLVSIILLFVGILLPLIYKK